MTDAEKYNVNLRIGKVVKHLLDYREESRTELAALLGCHVKTLNRRLGGSHHWTAWEVELIATHFGVPVNFLHAGPESLFAGVSGRSRWNVPFQRAA